MPAWLWSVCVCTSLLFHPLPPSLLSPSSSYTVRLRQQCTDLDGEVSELDAENSRLHAALIKVRKKQPAALTNKTKIMYSLSSSSILVFSPFISFLQKNAIPNSEWRQKPFSKAIFGVNLLRVPPPMETKVTD